MQFILILIVLVAGYFIFPQLQKKIKVMEGARTPDIEKAFNQEKDNQKKNIKFYLKLLIFLFIIFVLTIILYIGYFLR